MKFGLLSLLFMVGLAGCATPATVLKNEATGQVIQCGGRRSGSAAFGIIGYNIQKSNDEKCVQQLEAQGFKPVQPVQ